MTTFYRFLFNSIILSNLRYLKKNLSEYCLTFANDNGMSYAALQKAFECFLKL
tara:strand:- start:448 stop:606 length:159 start_codon:yes stop_codon:yes gene_type:complete